MNTYEWCVIVVVALDIVAYSVAHKHELTTKGYVHRDPLLEPSTSNTPGFDKQDGKSLMQWILKIVDIIEKHCNITSKPLYLATTTAAYGNSTTDASNAKYKVIKGKPVVSKPRKLSLPNSTGKPVHATIDTRGLHIRAKPKHTNKNDKPVHLQRSVSKLMEPKTTTVSHNGLRPTRRIKSSQRSEEEALVDEYSTDPTDESPLYSTSQTTTTTMSSETADFSHLKPGYIAEKTKPIYPSRTIHKQVRANSKNVVNKRMRRPSNRSRKTSKHVKPNSATVMDDHGQLETVSRRIRPSYTTEKGSTFVPISTTLSEYTEEIADVTYTHIHDAANKPTKRSRYMIPSSSHSTNLKGANLSSPRKTIKSSRFSAKATSSPQRRRRPHLSVNRSTYMKSNSATKTDNPSHSTAVDRHTTPNLLKVKSTSAYFSRKASSIHPYASTDNPTSKSNSATITETPFYSTILYTEIADVTHTRIHDAVNKPTKRSRYMIPSSSHSTDLKGDKLSSPRKTVKSSRFSAKATSSPQRKRRPHHSVNISTYTKSNSATKTDNPSHSTAVDRHTTPNLLKVKSTSAHFSRKASSIHPYASTDNPTSKSNSATITDTPFYSTILYTEIADVTHTRIHDAVNKPTKRSRYMIPSSGIKRDDNVHSTIVIQGAKPGSSRKTSKSSRFSAKGAPRPQRRRRPHHSINTSRHMKAHPATTTNNPSHSTVHYRHTRPSLLKVSRTSAHFLRKASSTHPHASTDNVTSTSNPAATTDNTFYSTLFYKRIKSMSREKSRPKNSSRKVVPQHVINERPHHPMTNRVNTSIRTSKGRETAGTPAIMQPTTVQSSASTTGNTVIVPRIAETNPTSLRDSTKGTTESTTTELSSSDTFGIIGKTAIKDNLSYNTESNSADNTETGATVVKLDFKLLKENATTTDASTETSSSHSTNTEDIATTTATVNELNSLFATIPTATLLVRSPCEGKDPWSWLEIFGQEQTFHTKLIALGKKLKEKVALN